MKFKNIYTVAGLLGLFLLLQSRSGGPATQANLRVTGAPGDGTCANSTCHTAGAFEPVVSLELLDDTVAVTKYDPGKTYTLRMTTTAGTGSPARYGFQALSLNAANAQAGDWGSTLPSGIAVKAISNKKYIEHTAPRSSNVVELPWVAPVAGTGEVTFYASSLASNNNTQTSGDGNASGTLAMPENTVSTIAELGNDLARIEVLPNPVADLLNLRITSKLAGVHKIQLYDAAGNVVKSASTDLQVGQSTAQVPVGELKAGIYIVQLCGDGHLAAVQMVKL
ncbi:MAG: T9SS type A sorting domain-containing protein [Saprospiraceae bacterium]|jgi:hypothetical protein|nr:T9SS type A sorting domain-containing protein [Saprospiraceae bacterium]